MITTDKRDRGRLSGVARSARLDGVEDRVHDARLSLPKQRQDDVAHCFCGEVITNAAVPGDWGTTGRRQCISDVGLHSRSDAVATEPWNDTMGHERKR